VALTGGTHRWHTQVAHTGGTHRWHSQVALTGGTHRWHGDAVTCARTNCFGEDRRGTDADGTTSGLQQLGPRRS
jgi:hypothetical protein